MSDAAVRREVIADLATARLHQSPFSYFSLGGFSGGFGEAQHQIVRRLLSRLDVGRAPMILPDLIQTAGQAGQPAGVVTANLYIGLLTSLRGPIDLSGLTATPWGGHRLVRLMAPAFSGERYLFVASPASVGLRTLSIGGAGGFDILPTFLRRSSVATVDGGRLRCLGQRRCLLG